MDFTLSDEQELLRSTARTLFAKECPTALVRAAIDDPSAMTGLWARLREWVVLGVGPLVDHCLFLEEAGAALAPGPYTVTSALFVPLLHAVGHPLAEVAAAGDVTGTAILGDVLPVALDADRVDHVAHIAPGGELALDTAGEPIPWLDLTRPAFLDRKSTDGVPLRSKNVERAVVQRATVALSAELIGTAHWLLAASVDYAKERRQFDRPIGSFQAVQHKLADMALDLERARAAVYYAAMTFDADDRDRERAVHVAKAAAGTAAMRCARDGIQVHGGIGYTWDHDLHLYLRRAYAGEHVLGTTAWHHDRLANLILGD